MMWAYILKLVILIPLVAGLAYGSLWLWRRVQPGMWRDAEPSGSAWAGACGAPTGAQAGQARAARLPGQMHASRRAGALPLRMTMRVNLPIRAAELTRISSTVPARSFRS